MEFTGEIKQGHLPPSERLRVAEFLRRMEGKRVAVKIAPYRKRRSLSQNAFFHSAFLEAATEMFNDAGNDMSPDEVKEALKEKFGVKKLVTMPDGEQRYIPKGTRDYDTMEMETFLTKIRAWAAQYGYELPFPNEQQ